MQLIAQVAPESFQCNLLPRVFPQGSKRRDPGNKVAFSVLSVKT